MGMVAPAFSPNTEAGGSLHGQGQSGIYGEFQARQGYIVILFHKRKEKKKRQHSTMTP